MPMIEHEIEQRVCREAQAAGWFVRKLAWIGQTGAPDRLFIKDGRVVFIEFKRPGGRLSARQRAEISRMRAAGAEVYVAHDVLTAFAILGLG